MTKTVKKSAKKPAHSKHSPAKHAIVKHSAADTHAKKDSAHTTHSNHTSATTHTGHEVKKAQHEVLHMAAKNTEAGIRNAEHAAHTVHHNMKTAAEDTLHTAHLAKAHADKAVRDIRKNQTQAFNKGAAKAETFIRNANEATSEALDMSSYNMQAWNEVGNIAKKVLHNLSTEMMDTYQTSLSNCVEASKEAIACKTPSDIADLQSKNMQRVIEGYFNKSIRLNKILFDGYAKALAPLNEYATSSFKKTRKLIAA